jgi:catechol 2,3-dioxygenase-like lactoylglutathione lyase family enzyme
MGTALIFGREGPAGRAPPAPARVSAPSEGDTGMPDTPLQFQLRKIGHVVLNVSDLDAAVDFYTAVLGLQVSDRYPASMVPGGMVFLRCNTDHHGVALVGGASKLERSSLNHFAFEVGSLDEVFRARAWLQKHGVPIVFEGRRRAGCQIAVEFQDPDANNLEIYWGLDQVGTGGHVRPPSEWRQARTLEDAVANPVADQRLPSVS